jgi:hypothetical protein
MIVHGFAQSLDFKDAFIVLPESATVPQRKAALMLADEIEKRTQLRLKTVTADPGQGPAFLLKLGSGGPPEGFGFVSSNPGERPIATVTGNDDRGFVFGTGYLLRQLHMGRQRGLRP